MGFSGFIARRYLRAKKSQQAINIISWISVTGVTFCVAAMMIILSAINGLEGLVEQIYSAFDPEIRITLAEGKSFDANKISIKKIRKIEGVKYVSETVEEICILKNGDQWVHAVMKGVDKEFITMSMDDSLMIDGKADIGDEDIPYVIAGAGIADRLVLSVEAFEDMRGSLTIYAPVRSRKFTPTSKMFEEQRITLSGIYSVNPEYDFRYIIVPKKTAQSLMEYDNHITAVELGLEEGTDPVQVKNDIENLLGPDFEVKTKYEQNELMYKVNQSEKWFTFAMLVFVLILAAFNIMASLTMLIIDKKNDVMILKSMGATSQNIRNIFFLEGFFINLFGGILGILIGTGVTFLQMHFHLVKMEGTIIDHYPVVFIWKDLGFVLITILIIGSISAWLPVRFLVRRFAGGMVKAE